MPAQDRLWSDEEHRPAVTTQHPRERAQERAVGGFEARTRDLALQDRELMAQHEDLDIFRTIPATAEDEQVDHESDKTVETGHPPILAAPEPRRSPEHKTPGQHTRTNIRHPQVIHRIAALTCGNVFVASAELHRFPMFSGPRADHERTGSDRRRRRATPPARPHRPRRPTRRPTARARATRVERPFRARRCRVRAVGDRDARRRHLTRVKPRHGERGFTRFPVESHRSARGVGPSEAGEQKNSISLTWPSLDAIGFRLAFWSQRLDVVRFLQRGEDPRAADATPLAGRRILELEPACPGQSIPTGLRPQCARGSISSSS